ncbi:hypothetical protein TCAP_03163 [Tolypocladium capitatum]|uniref:Uncharacterized protein n=1 Tax=Tolypocladium capitatum TaxID=45235 RepID=A0A2K3QHA4_9HYPO|nr:hypothetical protein TCAP_03163 [Tolypocladium capitatum]
MQGTPAACALVESYSYRARVADEALRVVPPWPTHTHNHRQTSGQIATACQGRPHGTPARSYRPGTNGTVPGQLGRRIGANNLFCVEQGRSRLRSWAARLAAVAASSWRRQRRQRRQLIGGASSWGKAARPDGEPGRAVRCGIAGPWLCQAVPGLAWCPARRTVHCEFGAPRARPGSGLTALTETKHARSHRQGGEKASRMLGTAVRTSPLLAGSGPPLGPGQSLQPAHVSRRPRPHCTSYSAPARGRRGTDSAAMQPSHALPAQLPLAHRAGAQHNGASIFYEYTAVPARDPCGSAVDSVDSLPRFSTSLRPASIDPRRLGRRIRPHSLPVPQQLPPCAPVLPRCYKPALSLRFWPVALPPITVFSSSDPSFFVQALGLLSLLGSKESSQRHGSV